MEAETEDFARSDVDTEMTVLTTGDITGQKPDASDEVENLRNSLREVVHDDNVQPKMQCLMMDSSFSMVTMQGEDSGIAWETTPNRCTTPWASEAAEISSPAAVCSAAPGSHPAGKIIFVMDEQAISRRKKSKERESGPQTKAERQRGTLEQSSENISGRPELVEFSQPNVKAEEEGDHEEPTNPLKDKEQRLFSLVSEGSEILNIVVPPKLATVDEEVSKEMMDNLSYLEEILVPKASEETHDYELLSLPGSGEVTDDEVKPLPHVRPGSMDPPGAPVARPVVRGAAGNVDYFEAFSLIDSHAPGSPAVITQGQAERATEAASESQDIRKPVQSIDNTITLTTDNDKSDTISLEEITSELLDEVFYGGSETCVMKTTSTAEGGGCVRVRHPSKPSGSSLFTSQEDILTPIFLPEGPPKIIDPILLEEPKAMAFLYTDLYEEATGSRQKEEDTESLASEKSFHSRHSDREARGYLEKYVLIDETSVVEAELADEEKHSKEGPRVIPQDLYEFGDLLGKSAKVEVPHSEEEVTDFFRSSANSSPCDIEPFPQSLEGDDTQTTTKSKTKTERSVSIAAEKTTETPTDQLNLSSFDFPLEEPDWGSLDDYDSALDGKGDTWSTDQDLWKQDSETTKPVAPPRRKAASSPKACLDLTPLTPVGGNTHETEEGGGKEQREEEKETASPAETADEGDGEGEDMMQASSQVALSESVLASLEMGSSETENVQDSKETNVSQCSSKTDGEGRSETETAATEIELMVKSESNKTEINPEEHGGGLSEPSKSKGHCIIL
ncbi:uncharacterized protein KZ484_000608 [Pholidichthys leucotaenia]